MHELFVYRRGSTTAGTRVEPRDRRLDKSSETRMGRPIRTRTLIVAANVVPCRLKITENLSRERWDKDRVFRLATALT